MLSVLALSFGSLVPAVSADHSWGGYHWARTSNPFTLKVGDNVSSKWDSYLDEAIGDWNASTILDLTKVNGSTSPRTCKALGLAQIWVSGSHITKAVAKVNDTYFNTSTYNKPAWRRLVMCQEIAHDFGLDHQDEKFNNANLGSCMDYTSDPDGPPSNEHPNAHDFEEIESIYAHLDGTTTIGQTTGPGRFAGVMGIKGVDLQDIDLDNPSAWGKAIRQDARGRNSLHVRDLGRGEKVFTFVTWVQ